MKLTIKVAKCLLMLSVILLRKIEGQTLKKDSNISILDQKDFISRRHLRPFSHAPSLLPSPSLSAAATDAFLLLFALSEQLLRLQFDAPNGNKRNKIKTSAEKQHTH